MLSNRSRTINRPERASKHELKPIPIETPLERFEMLGVRLANPDLDMHEHSSAGRIQRSGGADEFAYKGKKRQISVIGVFAISGTQELSLDEVRVELFSLKNHKTKGHSKVERVEVDRAPYDDALPDNALCKLHKGLDLVEFAVTAIELDQDIKVE